MSLIPYPNVPPYPGVPTIPRASPGSPNTEISLHFDNAQLPELSGAPLWGIFTTVSINQSTGAISGGNPLYSPSYGTVSTFAFAFTRTMSISDFPIEAGAAGQGAAFASFNKVWQPANPIVTLAVSGPDSDLKGFLVALDAACISTNLYDVVTPDASYNGYSIESYSYQRTAQRGATMLMVEISLKEILQISPSYTNQSNSIIHLPQAPSAANAQNSGLVVGGLLVPGGFEQLSSDQILGVGGTQ